MFSCTAEFCTTNTAPNYSISWNTIHNTLIPCTSNGHETRVPRPWACPPDLSWARNISCCAFLFSLSNLRFSLRTSWESRTSSPSSSPTPSSHPPPTSSVHRPRSPTTSSWMTPHTHHHVICRLHPQDKDPYTLPVPAGMPCLVQRTCSCQQPVFLPSLWPESANTYKQLDLKNVHCA